MSGAGAGAGAAGEGACVACQRCQGKLHICQISKQVISANNSEKRDRPVRLPHCVQGSLTPSLFWMVMVVVLSPTPAYVARAPVPFVLFVHVNCFCRAAETIEKFNKKRKQRKKEKPKERILSRSLLWTCALSWFFNEVPSFKKHIVARFDCCFCTLEKG